MGLLLLIVEIVIAGFLAVRLGSEATDKGFSNVLFILLSALLWFVARVMGTFIGLVISRNWFVSQLVGWLFALAGYCIFYYIISRIKDKELLNTEDMEWKKRNSMSNPAGTEKPEEK